MLISLYNSVASPPNDRLVVHTLTQKVTLHVLVTLIFYGFAIKTFMYDGLQHKGKLFEISKREISDVDPASWIPDVSVEVGSSVDEKSNEARGFQKEERKCPEDCCR